MIRTSLIAVVIASVLTVVGCTSSIQSDYDHQADFTTYSTFAWFDKPETGKTPTAGANQIVDGRIRRAIAENLTSKGFSQTSPAKADVFITYYTSLSSQIRMYSTGWGYGGYGGYGRYWGYGYGYWPGWGSGGTYTYYEGTIIIDIIDGGKRQLVWRGVVTKALNKKSSSEEKINKSISRVMLDFPPT